MPVDGDMNLHPQMRLTLAVTDTALPSGARKLHNIERMTSGFFSLIS